MKYESFKSNHDRLGVSTGTSIPITVEMDVDRITEFTAEFLCFFLR